MVQDTDDSSINKMHNVINMTSKKINKIKFLNEHFSTFDACSNMMFSTFAG